jgi:hypothetical protein
VNVCGRLPAFALSLAIMAKKKSNMRARHKPSAWDAVRNEQGKGWLPFTQGGCFPLDLRSTPRWRENPWPAATPWPATDCPGAAAPPQKLSGTAWVPIAFDRRRGELLAMTITNASGVLAEESKTASDCAKPLQPRYIEKLLRDRNFWPKARRNSSKQRPK